MDIYDKNKMYKTPKFELFQRESRIKFIRKEIENNKYTWLELLYRKMRVPKSSISNYLKTYLNNNVEVKKEGKRKLIILKNKEVSKKERECYKKAEAIRYLQKCRRDGYSYNELYSVLRRKKFNFSLGIGTIISYTKHIRLSKNGVKRLKEKIKRDRRKAQKLSIKKQIESGRDDWNKYLNYDPTKPIKRQPKKLTKEKARLIGHCLFDGYIDLKNYVIAYFSNIEEQVNSFIDLVKKTYGLNGEVKSRKQGGYYCRICSKKAVKDLIKYSPDYSTRSDRKIIIPKEILSGSLEIKRSFLRAFWDDEGAIICNRRKGKGGYYHLTRKLEAFCENENIGKDLQKLHNDLIINSHISRKRITISGTENLKKFKEVGFSDYVRVVSKKSIWYGIEKYKILDHCINLGLKYRNKVFIKNYGCAFNKIDTKNISYILSKMGYEITEDANLADLIFINSCGVKSTTQNKILSFVEEIAKKKEVFLGGCLPRMVEISNNSIKVFDNNSIYKIPSLIFSEKTKILSSKKEDRIDKFYIENNEDSVILPLSQGCSNYCSYCSVKFARGRLKSYEEKRIINRIKEAIDKNCKIVHLTAQDTGAYGLDKHNISQLPALLSKITKLKGNFKIKIGMMNPQHILPILDKLIQIYESDKIVKFLHIPVQSGSDKVLREMGRRYSIKEFKEIANRFRKEIPNIRISTDIIVGYPTETEEDFKRTLELIKEIKPDVLNISRFSARPGTRASKLKQLTTEEIKKRSRILTEEFKKIKK